MRTAPCYCFFVVWVLIGVDAAYAAPAESRVLNVLDFGAKRDGSAPLTEAFRAAIAAAQAQGGGTVVVPTGHYLSGPIGLVSHLTFEVESGAVIEFPAQRLPYMRGRMQGVEAITPVPLIGGENLSHVTIDGGGVLTTRHDDWLRLMGAPVKNSAAETGGMFGAAWNRILDDLEEGRGISEEEYRAVAPALRPSFIEVKESRDVTLRDIHIEGSPMWAIQLLYSANVVVDGVTIETYPGKQTDGIVVDSSREVRISNCLIDTGDDGIVLKSGKDADGLRVNRPTEDVTITNCNIRHAHGGVVLGSETSGGIRNVVASNIECDGTQVGIRVKSRRGRGGVVENVRFGQWVMRHVGVGISVTNYYVMEGETRTSTAPVTNRTPRLEDIAISGVSIDGAKTVAEIEGLPEMPIRGLHISDLTGSGERGLAAYNTAGLVLDRVTIGVRTGPDVMIRDSTDAELDAIASQEPRAEAPVIRLDRCAGAIVRDSHAVMGTGTFLSVGPGEREHVALVGDVLGAAKEPVVEEPDRWWAAFEAPPDTN